MKLVKIRMREKWMNSKGPLLSYGGYMHSGIAYMYIIRVAEQGMLRSIHLNHVVGYHRHFVLKKKKKSSIQV